MKFKKINPNNNDIKTIYHLMIAGIAPRPIALVGSIDKNGLCNLAPFSFFNAFGANPPIVGFSPALSGRTGLPKDTLLNIKETKEFTISIVTPSMVDQVSLASCEFEKGVDEFIKAGMTKKESEFIKSPSVNNSPFIMECKLQSIVELGGKPASGNLILGEVVLFHINEEVISSDGLIDSTKINQVGRAGGPWYSEIKKSLFKLNKPKGVGIGFDCIPLKLLNSNLTGKQLAKLASISELPDFKNIDSTKNVPFDFILDEIKILIDDDLIDDAWKIFISWERNNE